MATLGPVSVDGLDLWVEAYGEGPPILGIHGTPSSSALWRDAAGVLAGHGRTIIYDRRGFGRSKMPVRSATSDLADHVEDAARLIAALDARPAAVIGRSTGGQIAIALARLHPESVSALVLLEPALFTVDPTAEAWARRLRETVLAEAVDEPGRASESVIRHAIGDAAWESLPADLRAILESGAESVLAEMRGDGLDLSATPLRLSDEDLASIGVPTLLVSAEDSPAALRVINDRLTERLPRARHVVVSGDHFIHPAHEAVLEFLSDLSGPRA